MNQIDTATDLGAPPEMGRIRTSANQIAFWSWCAMLFCIPFSTALGLLFSAIAVVSGLVGFYVQSFKTAIRQPAIAMCIALFGWLTISMFWSIAPKAEMLEAWSKYRKLLYPALALMVLYNLRKSPTAMIFSFLAGNGLVALVSLASAYGLLHMLLGPPEVAGGWYIGPGWLFIGGPDNPTFGRNHITQGAFLTFAAMLATNSAWVRYVTLKKFNRDIIGFYILTILLLTPIFKLQGRSGYVLLAFYAIFWAFIFLRNAEKKHKLVFMAALFVPIFTMLSLSPNVSHRINVMTTSVSTYATTGKMSDSAVRLHLWEAGIKAVVPNSAVWGIGLGGYAEAYDKGDLGPEWIKESRSQPHSEIILMLVQGGFIGLFLYTAIFAFSVWIGCRSPIIIAPISAGLPIIYFIDSIFNSVIWDLAEGHFLILPILISLEIYNRKRV